MRRRPGTRRFGPGAAVPGRGRIFARREVRNSRTSSRFRRAMAATLRAVSAWWGLCQHPFSAVALNINPGGLRLGQGRDPIPLAAGGSRATLAATTSIKDTGQSSTGVSGAGAVLVLSSLHGAGAASPRSFTLATPRLAPGRVLSQHTTWYSPLDIRTPPNAKNLGDAALATQASPLWRSSGLSAVSARPEPGVVSRVSVAGFGQWTGIEELS